MNRGVWLVLLVLALLVAGCGATTTVKTTAKTTENPSLTATAAQSSATPAPTPLLTPSASQLAACDLTDLTGAANVWLLGDLVVTVDLAGVSYPSRKLPDGTPLAPFHVIVPPGGGINNATIPSPDPAVNPSLAAGGGGYMLQVCNSSSSQVHTLKGMSARIESAAAYAGQLNAWDHCNGGIYDASTKQIAEGCGGGFCASETLKATFATTAAGTRAAVTQVGSDQSGCSGKAYGPLPVSLKSHDRISINVGIAIPSAQATLTFAFGLTQGTSAPVFLPATGPILLAPVEQKWTGEACTSSAMQSRIPATSTPTYYICPAS